MMTTTDGVGEGGGRERRQRYELRRAKGCEEKGEKRGRRVRGRRAGIYEEGNRIEKNWSVADQKII